MHGEKTAIDREDGRKTGQRAAVDGLARPGAGCRPERLVRGYILLPEVLQQTESDQVPVERFAMGRKKPP